MFAVGAERKKKNARNGKGGSLFSPPLPSQLLSFFGLAQIFTQPKSEKKASNTDTFTTQATSTDKIADAENIADVIALMVREVRWLRSLKRCKYIETLNIY